MKIGTIITCFLPSVSYGGPVYSTTQRVSELSRRGHDVTVLTSDILNPRTKERTIPGVEESEGGFKIIRFPSVMIARHFSGIFSLPMLSWLHKYGQEFDVFHISYMRELIPVLSSQVLLSLKVKVFLQTHGTLNRRDGPRSLIDKLITENQLKRAYGVIVLQDSEDSIIKQISPESKRVILPNGIRLDDDIPVWKGLQNSLPIVLFLARLHPRKCVMTFIKAAHYLLAHNSNIIFRIVGPDGGDESKAREYVEKNDLSDHFIFIGEVSRSQALLEYANANLYVLPSLNEPFATTITEALAVGVPTIVNNSTQNINLLQKYNSIETVNNDYIELAKSIEKLLNNKELCVLRSKNGKDLVMNELAIERLIDRLENHYCT